MQWRRYLILIILIVVVVDCREGATLFLVRPWFNDRHAVNVCAVVCACVCVCVWWNGELVVQWRGVWCLHALLVTRLARSPSHTHTRSLPPNQPTLTPNRPLSYLFLSIYPYTLLVARVSIISSFRAHKIFFLLSISFITRRQLMCILVIIIFSFII